MTTGQRVIGYVRVSTDGQSESGASVEHQRECIRKECARRGLELVRIAEDDGISGKNLNRPALQGALRDLIDGNAEVLMAAKLDRLSRSVKDVCQIGDMAGHHGFELILLDAQIDTTSPYGRAQLNMMATFAQLERELIGQRTKDALAVKKAQGVRLGAPTSIGAEVEEKILAMRAGGMSMNRIADALNAEKVPTAKGGARWYPMTVKKVIDRAGAAA